MAYHGRRQGEGDSRPTVRGKRNGGTSFVSDRQMTPARRCATRGAAPVILRLVLIVGLLGGWLGAAPPTLADEDDPAFVAFGLGWYDINKQKDDAADFRLEYRHGEKIWLLKPWAGIEGTSDGAVYGVAGVLIDIYFGRRFVLTPSFGFGAYANGDGKDLGGTLEFRSQIELAYRFDDRSRLGLAFSHISNADTGDDNPGTEILNVYYAIPIDSIFAP